MSEWKLIHEERYALRVHEEMHKLEVFMDEQGQFSFELPELGINLFVSAIELWKIAKEVMKHAEGDGE